ncbi:hypothetical protein PoB_006892700 [Plakobranchus ocellatus]|uniref:Uncharacterized protein n=1 Tax=Plakobranchus ocellatus TaxID=259542 RepID=A0AAV4DDU1_9GAST|nr:hypothetical protein PoB_006892700 [Plakobranchus ocellatus]
MTKDHGVEFSLQTDILVGTAEALRYPARWACQAHKSLSSLARCLDKRGEQVHAVTDAVIGKNRQKLTYLYLLNRFPSNPIPSFLTPLDSSTSLLVIERKFDAIYIYSVLVISLFRYLCKSTVRLIMGHE